MGKKGIAIQYFVIAFVNKFNHFPPATEHKAKKLKQSQGEEDLLRHVLSLRSRAPQQYSINLIQQNVKYFKNLVSCLRLLFSHTQILRVLGSQWQLSSSCFQNKIDAAIKEPFAPNFKFKPYQIELSDDMFEKQTSRVSDSLHQPPTDLHIADWFVFSHNKIRTQHFFAGKWNPTKGWSRCEMLGDAKGPRDVALRIVSLSGKRNWIKFKCVKW